MKATQKTISPLKTLSCSISIAPVYNVLNSLSLLNAAPFSPLRLSSWFIDTLETLDPKVYKHNQIVLNVFRVAIEPKNVFVDFSSYLDELSAKDPNEFRQDVVNHLCQVSCVSQEENVTNEALKNISNNIERCIQFIPQSNQTKFIDIDIKGEIYALIENSREMKKYIISHLKYMWEVVIAVEWKRSQSILQQQVDFYNQYVYEDTTTVETFRFFTGKDLLREIRVTQGQIEAVVLVPSLHNGRYVTFWQHDRILHIFFSAPPNYRTIQRSSLMSKDEIRAKLKTLSHALSDQIRISILELLILSNELTTQDIMKHFDISQPSLSRHLKQLVNAEYVYEYRDRVKNRKVYTVNALGLENACRALELFKVNRDDFYSNEMRI